MSDIILDISAGRDRSAAQPLDDTPFRIALLGDFSGRASRGASESGPSLVKRPAWAVDRDDLDRVMAELRPTVRLQLEPGGAALAIRFESLEDFHPDRLFERLPLFQALRDLRQRLANPATFKAAAAEMTGEAPPSGRVRVPSGSSVLGDILDEAAPPGMEEALAEAGGDLHAFIQRVLKPHLVPNPDPRQAELVAQVEAAASATLRAILHAPEFQALEGLWRATDLLVRQVETSADLKILLIDLSEAELLAALPPGGDPAASPVCRLLASLADPVPWSLLVGCYTFGGEPAAVDRLAQLAAIALLFRAPWISGAHPSLAGVGPDWAELSTWSAPSEGWQLFRGTSLARSLGLVLPRFLARLPYGKGLEECEQIRFEELAPGDPAQCFLWGNPAIMVALILGRSFAEHGWALMRGLEPEISGLPFCVLGRGQEARAVGPGEGPLTVRAADALLERGLMPLAPLKESDRVRLVRLQSAADPVATLLGRWEG
jgi:type VI secretion system protein ImpC